MRTCTVLLSYALQIGLDMSSKMAEAPSGKPAGVAAKSEEDSMLDQRAEDLLKQLQAL
jgi:hypothetical protein